jgi:hydrogenase maturation protease
MNKTILVSAIGNPGRSDDGLGFALISSLDFEAFPQIEFSQDYQLHIESALTLCNKKEIIFVDASHKASEPFSFEKASPSLVSSPLYTHSLQIEEVLCWCETLYQIRPNASILAIRGYEWELKEGLSPKAEKNLKEARHFLEEYLRNISL